MKNVSNRSQTLFIGLFLIIIVLLVISLFRSGRYDVKIYDHSTHATNKSPTTTLTCEFSESSAFIKEEGNDYIDHTAGVDKNGKPVVVTFTDIGSDKPQLDLGIKLENGSEWVDELLVMNRSDESILFVDRIPGGNPSFYTLFPDLKVAVWQQSDSLLLPAPHRLVSSLDSMGFCY